MNPVLVSVPRVPIGENFLAELALHPEGPVAQFNTLKNIKKIIMKQI